MSSGISGCLGVSDDLPVVVDAVRPAIAATQRAQIQHARIRGKQESSLGLVASGGGITRNLS